MTSKRKRLIRRWQVSIKTQKNLKQQEKEQKRKVQKRQTPPVRPRPVPRAREIKESMSPAGQAAEESSREQERGTWQGRAQQARKRVSDLEEKCAGLKQDQDQGNRKQLIFGRPQDRSQAKDAAAAYTQCQSELEAARKYLKVDLPEEARRAGAPPGWIR